MLLLYFSQSCGTFSLAVVLWTGKCSIKGDLQQEVSLLNSLSYNNRSLPCTKETRLKRHCVMSLSLPFSAHYYVIHYLYMKCCFLWKVGHQAVPDWMLSICKFFMTAVLFQTYKMNCYKELFLVVHPWKRFLFLSLTPNTGKEAACSTLEAATTKTSVRCVWSIQLERDSCQIGPMCLANPASDVILLGSQRQYPGHRQKLCVNIRRTTKALVGVYFRHSYKGINCILDHRGNQKNEQNYRNCIMHVRPILKAIQIQSRSSWIDFPQSEQGQGLIAQFVAQLFFDVVISPAFTQRIGHGVRQWHHHDQMVITKKPGIGL